MIRHEVSPVPLQSDQNRDRRTALLHVPPQRCKKDFNERPPRARPASRLQLGVQLELEVQLELQVEVQVPTRIHWPGPGTGHIITGVMIVGKFRDAVLIGKRRPHFIRLGVRAG